jgi:uncharacterized membrane protein YjfL (UPF0719 family)
MEQLIKLISLPTDIGLYLLMDIAIVLGLLWLVRFLAGMQSKVNVSDELANKDNIAFGISVAGRMLALCLVLSAVVGRHVGQGFDVAALGMLLFGVIGIVLVKLGRVAHDKVVLHRLTKDEAIARRNSAVATVDASSAIGSAVIIYGVIAWVEGSDTNAVVGIVTGFFVALTILLFTTRVYELRFARNNQIDSMQGQLRKGNMALGIQHSGNLLGTAIVVSSVGHILQYDADTYVSNATGWLLCGVLAAAALALIVGIAKRLVLIGVDWKQEVDIQENIGVAALEWVLSVGIALITLGIIS